MPIRHSFLEGAPCTLQDCPPGFYLFTSSKGEHKGYRAPGDATALLRNMRVRPLIPCPPVAVFTTEEAAEYVGLTRAGFLHHVNAGHVPFVLKADVRIFTSDDLDDFKSTPRHRGRPRRE